MEQVENMAMSRDDNATDYVGIDELMSESEESTVEQNAPDDAGTAQPAPVSQPAQEQTDPQADVDRALGKRLYDERAKQEQRWKSSPQYRLG